MSRSLKYGWFNAHLADILFVGSNAIHFANKSYPNGSNPFTKSYNFYDLNLGNVGLKSGILEIPGQVSSVGVPCNLNILNI